MKIKLAALLCTLLTATAAHSQKAVQMDSLEDRNGTYYYEGQPFTGYADSFNEKMQMYARQHIIQGRSDGPFTGYYDEERTQIGWEVPCRRNKMEGMYIAYHENGLVSFTVEIHRSKMRGKRYCYDEQGRLWHIHTYRRDKQHGPKLIYYTPSGQLFLNEWYRNDKRSGRVRTYYDSHLGGGIRTTGQFRNGEKVGLWRQYSASGKPEQPVRYRRR